MTPTDRTRERWVRMLLAWAAVMTAAASICSAAYLAWQGLDQAATAVATAGAAAVTIGGAAAVTIGGAACAHARPRVTTPASDQSDVPVGPNGDNAA